MSLFLIVLQENLTGRYFDKCWVLITHHQYQWKSCYREEKMKSLPLVLNYQKCAWFSSLHCHKFSWQCNSKSFGSQVKQSILTSKLNFLMDDWQNWALLFVLFFPFSLPNGQNLVLWSLLDFLHGHALSHRESSHWLSWCSFFCTFPYNDSWGKQCLKNFR